jgi:hypothetical protein
MRIRTAPRLGVLLALALVLAAAWAAPAAARKGRVWETHACAEEFGTAYGWNTTGDPSTFELTLSPDVPTACVT